MPGDRKIHPTAIPRLGGLAVVASIALVLTGIPWLSGGRWELPLHFAMPLALGVLPVFLISLLDDIKSVGARKKLLAHTIGACVAVALGVSLEPVVHLLGTPIHIGIFAIPLSVLWIVGVTNAFNLIDGLDGLSAGLALISASSMAAVFMLVGQPQMGGVVLVLAGALAGFLPYNVHPARMFLGRLGSHGYRFLPRRVCPQGGIDPFQRLCRLAACVHARASDRGYPDHHGSADGGPAGKSRGRMFEPDRNHIHHRLLALGMDHGKAVLILYGAGLLLAIAAFVSVFLNAREAGLFVVALLLAGFVGVHRLGYAEFAFIRRGTVLKVYELPAVKRGMFVVFVDIFLAIVTAYLAVGLKGDEWSLTQVRRPVLDLATTFAPVTVLLFWWLGMYRGSWKVAGLHDLTRACTAVLTVTVAGAIVVNILSSAEYPLSLFVIYGILSLILTASIRASYVVLETSQLRANHQGVPVLIYGAGRRGVAVVRELFRNSPPGLRPIGFIDDDVRKRGKLVSELPVFGTEREVEGIIHTHAARAVLIATEKIPTGANRARRRSLQDCWCPRPAVEHSGGTPCRGCGVRCAGRTRVPRFRPFSPARPELPLWWKR